MEKYKVTDSFQRLSIFLSFISSNLFCTLQDGATVVIKIKAWIFMRPPIKCLISSTQREADFVYRPSVFCLWKKCLSSQMTDLWKLKSHLIQQWQNFWYKTDYLQKKGCNYQRMKSLQHRTKVYFLTFNPAHYFIEVKRSSFLGMNTEMTQLNDKESSHCFWNCL